MATKPAPEKKPYEVKQPFWHAGTWRVEGEVLMLAEAEAKYLGDNLRLKLPVAHQPKA